jgi:hypothetical protein
MQHRLIYNEMNASLRGEYVNALEKASHDHAWSPCLEYCFRALYGLPRELQLELASETLVRYLSHFEKHWPGVEWPRKLLGDSAAWIAAHDRALPDEPGTTDPSDAAFFLGLDALLLAHTVKSTDNFAITASCVFAIAKAIQSQVDAIWEFEDPGGVKSWQMLSSPQEVSFESFEKLRGHTAEDNASAMEAMKDGWRNVVRWLLAHRIQLFPDPSRDASERDLQSWKDLEMTLPRAQQS